MARQQRQRRPKGEGSITKLPNGRLKMTITIGKTLDGKQVRKSVTADNKNELLKKVSELRTTTATRRRRDTPPNFSDVVNLYLKDTEGHVSWQTVKTYRNKLQRHFGLLYAVPIDKITPEMIDECLDKTTKENGEKLAPSSLSELKRRLATVFNWAIDKDIIIKSPMKGTKKRPKGIKKVDIALPNEEEMRAIISSTFGILKPLCLLAVSTGCRLGELLGIKMRDIDINKCTIDINSQKTKQGVDKPLKTQSSYRVIYVQPNILQEVLKLSPCSQGYLFGGYTYMSIGMRIHKWLHQAPEVPKGFSFHSFRHYHATQLLKRGVDVKAVSKRLGHASITTTLNIYTHWLPEVDQKASEVIKLDDLI